LEAGFKWQFASLIQAKNIELIEVAKLGEIMATITRTTTGAKAMPLGGHRSYSEVVEFLDAHWKQHYTDPQLTTMKALDKALGEPSKKITAVLVGGTNGKSLTIDFCTKLLKEEGIKVGAFYTPHIMNYNERFVLNNEAISNKLFTELANEVINTAATLGLEASTFELLTMMAILYFAQNNVDVALLEMFQDAPCDPTSICNPRIMVVTRLTTEDLDPKKPETITKIKEFVSCIKSGTYVVSGDQSKLNLQIIAKAVQERGGIWEMPIRKLAVLQYPYEQLHGRCAALAERVCQLFVDKFAQQKGLLAHGLLAKQSGRRGRPTLALKKSQLENPKKTLLQFWREESTSLPGRFHLLKNEKPTILLDNAANIDAIKNLLLGIRLLHYQRSLKGGLALIFACDKNIMNIEELLRLLRYFTKKTSAHIIFCPITATMPGVFEESWNVDYVINNIKSLKIKPKVAASFQEAFEHAKKVVEERHGLVVVAGSQSIIAEYWKNKGIKNILNTR
jgi:folylpolyglutamate synthase/dihydrofolate synthase